MSLMDRNDEEAIEAFWKDNTYDGHCLLCRSEDIKAIKSHIIPKSVLNFFSENKVVNFVSKKVLKNKEFYYQGFCQQCERKFDKYGETYFKNILLDKIMPEGNINLPKLDEQFVIPFDRNLKVSPVYYCLLSIVWRITMLSGLVYRQGTFINKWLSEWLNKVGCFLQEARNIHAGIPQEMNKNTHLVIIIPTSADITNIQGIPNHGVIADYFCTYCGPIGFRFNEADVLIPFNPITMMFDESKSVSRFSMELHIQIGPVQCICYIGEKKETEYPYISVPIDNDLIIPSAAERGMIPDDIKNHCIKIFYETESKLYKTKPEVFSCKVSN